MTTPRTNYGSPKANPRFVVNKAGTRWDMVKVKVPGKRERGPEPSAAMVPFLKGEASGDFSLAAILALRNILRTENDWTPNHRACTKSGSICEPTSPEAARWNVHGALEMLLPNAPRKTRTDILDIIKRAAPRDSEARESLYKWCEEARHSQVLHLLNMAIALRKADLGYVK